METTLFVDKPTISRLPVSKRKLDGSDIFSRDIEKKRVSVLLCFCRNLSVNYCRSSCLLATPPMDRHPQTCRPLLHRLSLSISLYLVSTQAYIPSKHRRDPLKFPVVVRYALRVIQTRLMKIPSILHNNKGGQKMSLPYLNAGIN